MSDVVIDRATHDDVTGLIAFWSVAAANDARPVDTPDALGRLLDRDPAAVLLARRGERIVGSLVVGWDGWRAHLYRLAVAPDARGHGVARRLLDEAECRLRALGATRIDAMVLDANDAAHGLWAAAGFARQPDWSRWVKPLG